jgi:hypothetical protein
MARDLDNTMKQRKEFSTSRDMIADFQEGERADASKGTVLHWFVYAATI